MNKKKLLSLGWTREKLLDRISNCRKFQKQYKQENAVYSYRFLNASFYLQARQWLGIFDGEN